MSQSRTLRIAIVSDLAALSVLLNQTIDIPAPYAPFLKYELWEIPIVVAFLISGLYTGLFVAVINSLVIEFTRSGIPSGPWFNFAAILSMMLGIHLIERIGKWKSINKYLISFATITGITTRTVIMTFVNLTLLPLSYPIGFSLPYKAVIAILPLIAFFNATVAVYTIPISYIIAKALFLYTKIPVRKIYKV